MSDRTPPPVLTLKDGAIGFGGKPLFDNADLTLLPGMRACLVGRNGSGKSTLLKILAGQLEPDRGTRFVQPGLTIGYLPQATEADPAMTVRAYVAAPPGRKAPPPHQLDEALDQLRLDGAASMASLSGGEARRAALARCLVGNPDILLLDEPTNHLDIQTILWLGETLIASRRAMLMISHDRAFLSDVATETLWLRGDRLLASGAGYRGFEAWAEQLVRAESQAAEKLKQKIKAEQHWLIHGVTARRRRNQGRLKKLAALRAARADLLRRRDRLPLAAGSETASGRLVIDAEHLTKSYGARTVIDDFSTRIMRGDRIGIVGPNGSGKTTLINLLIGRTAPDAGTLRLGAKLETAYFDQTRAALDPAKTLWNTLLPGGGDSIMVQGRQRHVVAYLKDFMFDDKQAKAPVGSLSGGERNRLLLAMTLARPANFLVLDEPTNDLDMETLDMLEDMLADFVGTILVVSHDRDFLDRIVTSTIVLAGDGSAVEHAGGYADLPQDLRRRLERRAPAAKTPKPKRHETRKAAGGASPRDKLSYAERRELDQLPQTIERLEDAKRKLEIALADPALYARNRATQVDAAEKLAEVQDKLARAEERWLELEARRERLAAGTG